MRAHRGYLPNLPDLRGCIGNVHLQFAHSRNAMGVQLGAHKANYDSGSGLCMPIRYGLDFDRFQKDCLQAGTVDGYFRYKDDDTVDTSVKLFVHYASASCDEPKW
ncbi:hypothetical protein E4U44_002594 [Claviceps purpurea]|nr:hypothetical protein E4U44_002594 [Claviceps purpurea]